MSFDNSNNSKKSDYLANFSPKDRSWDKHRAVAQHVEYLYSRSEFKKYSARIGKCSLQLAFSQMFDLETGEFCGIKLQNAFFCRVRSCPVCQWRRSLMWRARFHEALPKILEQHPKSRWIFATFTVRNCEITELRKTIQQMNSAWNRLRLRKEFGVVLGWIKTIEVTQSKDGTAHPHFHVLMQVPPSYFSTGYIRQDRWVSLWAEVMRLDYLPVVDIRAVKAIGDAAKEVLKYAVKADDLVRDKDWLIEYTKQTYRLRFISTGGTLKDAFQPDEEKNDDLIHFTDDSEISTDPDLFFGWQRVEKKYKKD